MRALATRLAGAGELIGGELVVITAVKTAELSLLLRRAVRRRRWRRRRELQVCAKQTVHRPGKIGAVLKGHTGAAPSSVYRVRRASAVR